MGAAAAIVGGSALAGGLGAAASIYGSRAQAEAAQRATALQQQMWATAQKNLQPYMQGGSAGVNMLTQQMPDLTAPFSPTMNQLQSMPGYQFELQQGLQAAQNGFAARGLGSSGAAMKGAAQYAQGLASNDLMNLSNLYYTNQNNAYNKLMGLSSLGENAASGTGSMGAQYGSNIADSMTGAGNATGAGYVGAANAIGSAINGGMNNYLLYNMSQMQNPNMLLSNSSFAVPSTQMFQ